MDNQRLVEIAKSAALQAGDEVMQIYESNDFQVETKEDDSPLTKADKASHEKICEILEQTGLPILSEEGKDIPFSARRNWDRFWMIDPLDGTKEFIKRNGEFTVNIALIENNLATLGVVYAPVLKWLYWGFGSKAFKEVEGSVSAIHASNRKLSESGLKVVASRSHLNTETEGFINKLNEPDTISMGSSLKLLLVAEGKADVYPRYAPTMEWDTAAAHAVVSAAGGTVFKEPGQKDFEYNKADLLNPHFLVVGY